MLSKKFALGFGIAVILPMLVHYGVSTFSPAPKFPVYVSDVYNATPQQRAQARLDWQKKQEGYANAQKVFHSRLFMVSVPVGIAAILIGTFSPIEAIGTGLMFGGIFILVDGYAGFWPELEDWMRFVSLLIAFVVLIYIGYRKFSK